MRVDASVDAPRDTGSCQNPTQHDEDSDGIDDACDPCPHIAAGGTDDTDGDGVGDACDPAPRSATERWLVFDPLTSRAAAWTQSNAVTFGTDSMVIADGFIRYNIALTNFRVQIGGELEVTPNTVHQMVLELAHEMFSHYYYAEFYGDQADGYVKITRRDDTVYTTIDDTMYTGPIPGGPFQWTVDASVANQTITFDAVHGATDFPVLSGSTVPPLVGSAFVHIGTNAGITARVDYLALIGTTP